LIRYGSLCANKKINIAITKTAKELPYVAPPIPIHPC
jgi:hypothetical protein